MGERIVVALGGNALGKTPEDQLALVKNTAKPIVDLIEKGHDVIIGHGNGPQVGMINLAMEFSSNKGGNTPYMPFPECGAMTQGYIGYHLQQAIQEELNARGIEKECATVVTQVVVDEKDPGFQHPTKPVGSFYSKEEADVIAAPVAIAGVIVRFVAAPTTSIPSILMLDTAFIPNTTDANSLKPITLPYWSSYLRRFAVRVTALFSARARSLFSSSVVACGHTPTTEVAYLSAFTLMMRESKERSSQIHVRD